MALAFSSTASRDTTESYWVKIFLIKLLYKLNMFYNYLDSLLMTILGSYKLSWFPIHF